MEQTEDAINLLKELALNSARFRRHTDASKLAATLYSPPQLGFRQPKL
jgi:hypothetical protein